MKITVLVCAGLLLLPTVAYSGDQAWFSLLGFSEDGETVVWETGGIQDGSGFQWLNVEILDVDGSISDGRFQHVWDDCIDESPTTESIFAVEERKKNYLDQWKIQFGAFSQPLVFYPLTDLGASRDTVIFCLEKYVPDFNSGEITLTLLNKPADIEQTYPEWFDAPVTPVLKIQTNGDSQVFFSENTVPEQWTMTMSYSIHAIFRNPVIPDNIIVVLNTTEPGFEGPNGRFRVVSGEMIDID